MKNLNIELMNDGGLFDIDCFGESLFELLPTIYKINVGNKSYEVTDEDGEFFKAHNNATEVTIHLLAYQNEIGVEKIDL